MKRSGVFGSRRGGTSPRSIAQRTRRSRPRCRRQARARRADLQERCFRRRRHARRASPPRRCSSVTAPRPARTEPPSTLTAAGQRLEHGSSPCAARRRRRKSAAAGLVEAQREAVQRHVGAARDRRNLLERQLALQPRKPLRELDVARPEADDTRGVLPSSICASSVGERRICRSSPAAFSTRTRCGRAHEPCRPATLTGSGSTFSVALSLRGVATASKSSAAGRSKRSARRCSATSTLPEAEAICSSGSLLLQPGKPLLEPQRGAAGSRRHARRLAASRSAPRRLRSSDSPTKPCAPATQHLAPA